MEAADSRERDRLRESAVRERESAFMSESLANQHTMTLPRTPCHRSEVSPSLTARARERIASFRVLPTAVHCPDLLIQKIRFLDSIARVISSQMHSDDSCDVMCVCV